MSEENFKRDWGMEITWASEDDYCGKILVFKKVGDKMPLHFHTKTTKSWFVNNGKFLLRWVDTSTGKIYQQELPEGSVHKVEPLTPVSLECLEAGSAIAQTGNGDDLKDFHIVLTSENIRG